MDQLRYRLIASILYYFDVRNRKRPRNQNTTNSTEWSKKMRKKRAFSKEKILKTKPALQIACSWIEVSTIARARALNRIRESVRTRKQVFACESQKISFGANARLASDSKPKQTENQQGVRVCVCVCCTALVPFCICALKLRARAHSLAPIYYIIILFVLLLLLVLLYFLAFDFVLDNSLRLCDDSTWAADQRLV